MAVFKILSAGGDLLRKVMCPADEIELQLAAGEQAEEVDPLVDGLGVTLEQSNEIGAQP